MGVQRQLQSNDSSDANVKASPSLSYRRSCTATNESPCASPCKVTMFEGEPRTSISSFIALSTIKNDILSPLTPVTSRGQQSYLKKKRCKTPESIQWRESVQQSLDYFLGDKSCTSTTSAPTQGELERWKHWLESHPTPRSRRDRARNMLSTISPPFLTPIETRQKDVVTKRINGNKIMKFPNLDKKCNKQAPIKIMSLSSSSSSSPPQSSSSSASSASSASSPTVELPTRDKIKKGNLTVQKSIVQTYLNGSFHKKNESQHAMGKKVDRSNGISKQETAIDERRNGSSERVKTNSVEDTKCESREDTLKSNDDEMISFEIEGPCTLGLYGSEHESNPSIDFYSECSSISQEEILMDEPQIPRTSGHDSNPSIALSVASSLVHTLRSLRESMHGSQLYAIESEDDHDNENDLNQQNSTEKECPAPIAPKHDPPKSPTKRKKAVTPNKSFGSSSSKAESINLGLLIGHMQVMRSLEDLMRSPPVADSKQPFHEKKIKHVHESQTQNPSRPCLPGKKQERVQVRWLLQEALSGNEDAPGSLRQNYGLSQEDVSTSLSHLQLCNETNSEVRWDLIFRIAFAERGVDLDEIHRIVDPLDALLPLVLNETEEKYKGSGTNNEGRDCSEEGANDATTSIRECEVLHTGLPRHEQERMTVRSRVLAAVQGDTGVGESLRQQYGLSYQELSIISSHVQYCDDTGSEVQWEIIYKMIFGDAGIDLDSISRIIHPISTWIPTGLNEIELCDDHGGMETSGNIADNQAHDDTSLAWEKASQALELQERMYVRSSLLEALGGNINALQSLSQHYGLSAEDISMISSHLQLGNEGNLQVRWDLVFRIVFANRKFGLESTYRGKNPIDELLPSELTRVEPANWAHRVDERIHFLGEEGVLSLNEVKRKSAQVGEFSRRSFRREESVGSLRSYDGMAKRILNSFLTDQMDFKQTCVKPQCIQLSHALTEKLQSVKMTAMDSIKQVLLLQELMEIVNDWDGNDHPNLPQKLVNDVLTIVNHLEKSEETTQPIRWDLILSVVQYIATISPEEMMEGSLELS